MSGLLSTADFLAVVRDAPLVSIDLVVSDEQGLALVGERRNAPAKGFWFVPGGRIRKNENLDEAFRRITREELGVELERSRAVIQGVFEHFYGDNFSGVEGVGTHYVVLAYRLRLSPGQLVLPEAQHSHYRWARANSLAVDPQVHLNTRTYFVAGS